MSSFSDLFLTSSGRIARIGFVVAGGLLLTLWAAFDLMAPLATRDGIGWIIATALLYSAACLLSQRLHDRGRSGWWSGPILLTFMLAWPHPQAPLDWVAAAVLLFAAIDLALLPGQKAFNRYGAPPGDQSGASPS